MIEAYFSGVVSQLEERAKSLKARIPTSKLPSDYHALVNTCRGIIDNSLARLRQLRSNPRYLNERNQPERFRALKSVVDDLDIIEMYGVVALAKTDQEDHNLNGLIQTIAKEINYPLIPPVVTTLSQNYFHISCGLNLLMVPFLEGNFLLHLPDMYHELCHPLLVERDNPSVEPFKDALVMALGEVSNYLDAEQNKENQRRSPKSNQYFLQRWRIYWTTSWMTEFFCDLFGVYTLGTAFVWSHFHLVAKKGGDPFDFEMDSHPADAARMETMLHGLELLGFNDEATHIRCVWEKLLSSKGAHAERLYFRCYPEQILKKIAWCAYQGVKDINCRIVSAHTKDIVHTVLNQAWVKFWEAPEDFVGWEKQAIKQLYALN